MDISDRNQSFEELLAYSTRTAGITLRPAAPPQVRMVTIVSGNFFRVLGIEPEIGRSFHPDEDRVPGRDAVTILSYGMWKQAFGGDAFVLGQKIHIASVEFTIIGVAPERFTGIDPRPLRESAFVPLAMWPRLLNAADVNPLESRDFRAMTMKGRLKADVTLRQAQAELATVAREISNAPTRRRTRT